MKAVKEQLDYGSLKQAVIFAFTFGIQHHFKTAQVMVVSHAPGGRRGGVALFVE